jgi:hypothetical protein
MNHDKEKQLKEDFPQIFTDLHDCTPQESCMAWGIGCSDGWYDLIHKLCEDIMAANPAESLKVAQVKEKFGGLRFYTCGPCLSEVLELVSATEAESFSVCEVCGSKEEVTSEGSWIRSLCKKCRIENEEVEK